MTTAASDRRQVEAVPGSSRVLRVVLPARATGPPGRLPLSWLLKPPLRRGGLRDARAPSCVVVAALLFIRIIGICVRNVASRSGLLMPIVRPSGSPSCGPRL